MSGSTAPDDVVILWDVMDTVVYDPFRQAVPAVYGLDLPTYFALTSRAAYEAFERGEIDEATYCARLFTDGRPVPIDQLKAYLDQEYRYIPGIEPLLETLSEHGVEMHSMSNYSELYRRIEAKLEVSQWLPWTFVSCRTGLRKPDPETFLGAARVLGRPPQQVLFIDDREKNCRGARKIGMRAIQFHDVSQLRRDLIRHGLRFV